MFKKLLFSIICAAVALSVCAADKVTVRQNTKEQLVETLILAMLNEDADALWRITLPACRKKLAQEANLPVKEAKKQLLKTMLAPVEKDKNSKEMLRQLLNSPEQKKAAMTFFLKTFDEGLVKYNNKWYFDFEALGKKAAGEKTAGGTASAISPAKITIRQSTKEEMAETYFASIAYDDPQAMWQILDPEFRKMAIAECKGDEAAAVKMFWAGFRSTCPNELNKSFELMLKDPGMKKSGIQHLLTQNSKWFFRKNGKWYINPTNK